MYVSIIVTDTILTKPPSCREITEVEEYIEGCLVIYFINFVFESRSGSSRQLAKEQCTCISVVVVPGRTQIVEDLGAGVRNRDNENANLIRPHALFHARSMWRDSPLGGTVARGCAV